MDLKGKKVLVFGSGISGEAAAGLLFCNGADVVLYDGNEKLDAGRIKDEILQEGRSKASEKTHGTVSVVLGDFPEALLGELDLTVMCSWEIRDPSLWADLSQERLTCCRCRCLSLL